jgi:hypothetical protein
LAVKRMNSSFSTNLIDSYQFSASLLTVLKKSNNSPADTPLK